jgi:hypothetical protein
VAALATQLGACTEPAAAPAPVPGWPRIVPLRSAERGWVLALDHPGLHLEVGMRGGRAPGQVLRLGTQATDSVPALHGLGFGFEQAGAALPLRVNRVEAVREEETRPGLTLGDSGSAAAAAPDLPWRAGPEPDPGSRGDPTRVDPRRLGFGRRARLAVARGTGTRPGFETRGP